MRYAFGCSVRTRVPSWRVNVTEVAVTFAVSVGRIIELPAATGSASATRADPASSSRNIRPLLSTTNTLTRRRALHSSRASAKRCEDGVAQADAAVCELLEARARRDRRDC